ncbi:MAG TPA: FKBP-type peptidyl-prolyl cis-trans isomerase [Steroidobacteraceae bacterium]|nr:FKBP-type peptidyl-prolyl cis-trans isomerase [Steroidobacteraceae bacterium]
MRSPAPRRGRTVFIIHTAVALLAGAMLAQAQEPPTGSGASSPAPAAGTAKKAPAKSGTAAAATGPKSNASYSLGVSMGEQLRAAGVTAEAVSSERLAQGVRDGLSGKAKLTDSDRQAINEMVHNAHEALAETNHRAAATFLAENAKKPGVVTTASGLQYKVLSAGSGASPKATDSVVVNYRGTLLDGTEFDSSYKRGEPATLQVNRVIPGWTEALQLMKPGAKYQLFVPPQLAYDLRSPPSIPAGSMLIFDVELVSMKPGEQAGAATPPAEPAKPK